MPPDGLTEFTKIIETGGNVVLAWAAWLLWRATQSLARIETFMSVLFEVLLRSDAGKIRQTDLDLLRRMQSDMRNTHKQGGFISRRMLGTLIAIAAAGAFVAFLAFAQATATDAARISWTNATVDEAGNPLQNCNVTPCQPGQLIGTRIQRSLNCTATNFGTAAETLNVPHAVTSVLFENLPAGTWCYRARHVAEPVGTGDGLSLWSAVVQKVSVKPATKPARPVSITVE